MTELGAKPQHIRLVLRAWLAGCELTRALHSREHTFSPTVANALPALAQELDALLRVQTEHEGSDGSRRMVLALADNRTIECVVLPKAALCVSTQIGCAVGCLFCMSGRDGLLRNLTTDEILAQVVLARRSERTRRIVFMGMGEPSHNLANVLAAIDVLGNEGEFGHKELVFSTVGDRKVFARLMGRKVRCALALSLHTTNDALRAELLPRAPQIPAEELIELSDAYCKLTGHPLLVQWTLLAGINDTDAELERLEQLLRGRRAIVNFIPVNPIEGAEYTRPSLERAEEMARWLTDRRVLSTVRISAGQDVDGACGQLRARVSASKPQA